MTVKVGKYEVYVSVSEAYVMRADNHMVILTFYIRCKWNIEQE